MAGKKKTYSTKKDAPYDRKKDWRKVDTSSYSDVHKLPVRISDTVANPLTWQEKNRLKRFQLKKTYRHGGGLEQHD